MEQNKSLNKNVFELTNFIKTPAIKSVAFAVFLSSLTACGGGSTSSPNPNTNPTDIVDTDGDGIGNNADTDDDNDGVLDSQDAFPLDPDESEDTDGDGIGNNADTDDDGDGVADAEDAFPLDGSEWVDADGDGIGNNADTDDDNDGVADSNDAFPLDASEWADTDGDGIGNNADTDDDNDGVVDEQDAFPLDASESVDTDGDGIGNNADTDDDSDGVADEDDAYPLDASEWADTDGDGIGNNADTDDDNDGVADEDDAFPLDASESVDTDGDGIGNNADTDDDGDGVADEDDAYPLDASEWVDTDGDGIGNNADTDDDNDGVDDNADAAPTSAYCFAQSDALDGSCYIELLGQQDDSYAFAGADTKVYFYLESAHKILLYDPVSAHFDGAIDLAGQEGLYPQSFAYSATHKRIYLGYPHGLVTYFDDLNGENTDGQEQILAQLDQEVTSLLNVSDLMFVNAIDSSRMFDAQGAYSLSSIGYPSRIDHDIAWSAADNRIYFYSKRYSSDRLYYQEIDPATGERVGSGRSSEAFNTSTSNSLVRVSIDGSKVLIGNGHILQSSDLASMHKLLLWTDKVISEAIWLDNGELVIFIDGQTATDVYRFNTVMEVVETFSFSGVIEKAISNSESHWVVARESGVLTINQYQANDDSDGDGVNNIDDGFANDPAASVDFDGDGYPDTWNDGMTEQDSSSGLTLDSYPNDSACYLPEHGDGNVCDYSATVPDFTPDKIRYDEQGIVYLLHQESNRIYRWSSAEQSYINPLVVGIDNDFLTKSPHIFEYLPALRRIYLGYRSGEIRMINLDEGHQEQSFVRSGLSHYNWSQVGEFLVAPKGGLSNYSFNQDGVRTEHSYFITFWKDYKWNEYNNRLYSHGRFASGTRFLSYRGIDQSTGEVENEGLIFLDDDYSTFGPIVFSPTSDHVLLGSGVVYDADTLQVVSDLGQSFDAGIWVDNVIVMVTQNLVDSTVYFWDAKNYKLKGSITVDGHVEALIPANGDLTFMTVGNEVIDFAFQPIADRDEDGMPPWWEDLYGLDDNDPQDGALDGDDDELTNLQEYTFGTHPHLADTDNDGISDSIEINIYGTNPTNSDTDGDGLSDSREINELSTNPLDSDSDDDGLSDSQEVDTYQTNPLSADSDNDGMSDAWEVAYETNPNIDDAQLDNDADDLVNIDEYTYSTNPNLFDTDDDGLSDGVEVFTTMTIPTNIDSDADRMPDGWEVTYRLDPLSNDAQVDFDADGFVNLEEFFLVTDPSDIESVPTPGNWSSKHGNAANNGFSPVHVVSEQMALRWSISKEETSFNEVSVADGQVFVASILRTSNNKVSSFNSIDGSLIWESDSAGYNYLHPTSYANGYVYFQSGGSSSLDALNAADGSLKFQMDYDENFSPGDYSTPFDDDIYVVGGHWNRYLHKLDGNLGTITWSVEFGQRWMSDRWAPAVDDNYVYVFSNGLHKIDKNDGAIVSSFGPDDNDWSGITPVLGFADDLFAIADYSLVAYDLKTDAVKWRVDGNFIGSPAMGVGKVFANNRFALSVYDEFDGSLLWSWKPDNGDPIITNIVVAQNVVFVQSYTTTYAIDQQTGQQVWSYDKAGYLSLSNDGALLIAGEDGTLSAINIAGDTDNDGLPDWWEERFGLDKYNADDAALDTDSDGLTNLQEFNLHTDPTNNDTDGDGLIDSDEVNTYSTSPINADSDEDGISDGDEVNIHGTDPLSIDSDQDGLTDYQEINEYSTNPLSRDTDNDGLSDGWEVTYSTDPTVDDAQSDDDADGLTNLEEFNNLTNPKLADTDYDGLNDGEEVNTHNTNPVDEDSDADRMPDGWEVDYSFDPLSSTDSIRDDDSDGFANYEEYFLQTNPIDATDFALAQPWITYQANAKHDGFALQKVDSNHITQLWQLDVRGEAHQVVAAKERVFINYDGFKTQALSRVTGELLWDVDYPQAERVNPPAYANDKVFFQISDDRIDTSFHGINVITGETEFTTSSGEWMDNFLAPTPLADEIYFPDRENDSVYGFSQTGQLLFHTEHDKQGQFDDWTPTVDDQFVYVYYGPKLSVLDRLTGETQYEIIDENRDSNASDASGVSVIGSRNNIITVDTGRLISFDLSSKTVGWEKSSSYTGDPAIAYGRIYVVNNGILSALDEKSGDVLWEATSPFIDTLISNIVVTRNMVFVGSNEQTYGFDIDTGRVKWLADYSGHLSLSEGVLYIANNQKVVAFNVSLDNDDYDDDDTDGLPNWWELLFGLDTQDSTDAQLDNDTDGLSNLLEYTNGTYPLIADTDGDNLTDGDEVNVHLTNPVLSDTDDDGLRDGEEVNTYNTDPFDSDSDNDGFSDGEEVNKYGSDPNDAQSLPDGIRWMTESFESDTIPEGWVTYANSQADWLLTNDHASDGYQSLRSGDVDAYQQSAIEFSGLFYAGTFTFDARVYENRTDSLLVYVNDELVLTTWGESWHSLSFDLTRQYNVIRFVNQRDRGTSSSQDGVYIDNIKFEQFSN